MMSVSQSVRAAVDTTLAAIEPPDKDAAAAKLAQKYADALDEAKAIERAADKVLERVIRGGVDGVSDDLGEVERADLLDEVKALRNKLVARAALVAIGQRLEAVLNDLGATPSARAKQAPKGQPVAAPIAHNPLHRVRSS